MKIVLILLSIVLVSCSGGRNSTGYSIISDMMYPEAHEAQTKSKVFENGQTNQLPPANTIARGFMPYTVKEDANGDIEYLESPYGVDAQDMTEQEWKRGEHLFKVTCSACHGMAGKGDGEVVNRGFPSPPNFRARTYKYSKRARYTSGKIYDVITRGIGNMPSHAQQLYPEDRWYVAEYVRHRLMTKGKK